MQSQDKTYRYSFAMWISVLCLSITGCTTGSQNAVTPTVETKVTAFVTAIIPTKTVTASPTTTPQPMLTVTPSPIPIVLPAVTLSPQEAEDALVELLKTNGNCTGKCLAGIRPDEMTVQEAIDQMARWGMLRISEIQQGRTFINILDLDPVHRQIEVDLSVGTWSKNIDLVSFSLPGYESDSFLSEDVWLANRETWSAFRLDNLLKAYGIPSYIGFSFQTSEYAERPVNYGLEIQYEEINLLIAIGALAYADGNNIYLCPSKDPHNLGIQINPERPLIERQKVSSVTWEELTSSNLEVFYQKSTDESGFDECVITTMEKIIELDPS